MNDAIWTGLSAIDFVASSTINLFSLISQASGLGYWTVVGITVFVAWPLASFALYQYLSSKKTAHAPGCNA